MGIVKKDFKVRGQRSRSLLDRILQWRRHAYRSCGFEANLLATRTAALYIIISVISVCQTITVESLAAESSFSLISIRVKFVYENHRVKVKVTEAKKKRRKPLFSKCETSIGNNSASITLQSRGVCVQHGVSWLWRIEWRDCHLCHMTGSVHA